MFAVSRKSSRVLLLVLVLSGSQMLAQASPSASTAHISDVAVNPTPHGLVLTLDLTSPFLPAGVSLTLPNRLVFDFPGFTMMQGGARRILVNHAAVEDVRLALFSASPPVSRVVVDSRVPLRFKIKAEGNRVQIDIAAEDAEPDAADAVRPAASIKNLPASQANATPEKPQSRVAVGSTGSSFAPPVAPSQASRQPGAYALQSKARDLKLEDLQRLENKADAGDPESETILGLAYHAGILLRKDDTLAASLIQRAASQNFMAAEESLGIFAETGVGRNAPAPLEAIEWYKKAVLQGSFDAATNIGLMYADGGGIARDPAQAVVWFRKAAAAGDSVAQYNMALMYKRGTGVPQDENEYLRWLTLAADQNLVPAQLDLADFCRHPADGTVPDMVRALHYYQVAAEQGSGRAQVALGNIFAVGLEGKPDYNQAVKWFRRAADQGQRDGQFGLGVRYILGQGVPLDLSQARRLFTAAADQGQMDAQFNLALMYEEGNGTPVDLELARHYFQLAAEQGMPKAQFRLARLLIAGDPSSADRIAAYKWLMLAQPSIKESSALASDVRKSMSPADIQEAEHLVDNWRIAHR